MRIRDGLPACPIYLTESYAPPPPLFQRKRYSTCHVLEMAEGDDVLCSTSPSHLHTLPSLTILTIINNVRSETQLVPPVGLGAQVDNKSYMNSSLLVGLMFPSSPSPRLGSRKVISNLNQLSWPRSVPLLALRLSISSSKD